MNILLWVVAGVCAAAFLAAGILKLTQDRQTLIARGMGFVEDFPMGLVRFIGAAEVAGAVGLVLPPLTGIAPVLAPF